MTHTKTEWRVLLLKARAALNERARGSYSAAINGRLTALPGFEDSRAIFLYTPLGAEVDLRALTTAAAASGKAIYLPHEGASPAWVRQSVGSAGNRGERASIPNEPALVIVPGVGFDSRGIRLGRGRGFYDRALAALRRKRAAFVIGVAFEVQVVERLPRDFWDEPVDLVATERRLIVPLALLESQPTRQGAGEAYER